MKLINHTLFLLSAILFLLISMWAVLFYFQLLKQVKLIVDEGLADHKIVVIDKLTDDISITENDKFEDRNYFVRQVEEDFALQVVDTYKDTLIYSKLKNIVYPARLLTTAFVTSDSRYYEMKLMSQELGNNKLLKKIVTSLLWLYLLLFACIIVVNNFVLKKTWRPFYQLLDYLSGFRLDKGAKLKLQKTNIKEFELLNNSVKTLVETNIDIFNNQKQFIENVSHEMQTPLAIGINKLEMLAGETNLLEPQIKSIGNIIETLKRLSGMNKSLLMLSKIENRQFIAVEKVRFDELFIQVIKDFSDFASYLKININYQASADFVYDMNRDLAEILVMNLVKNAIFHNHQNGEVRIRLTSSSFVIENTSDGGQLPDHIFKRFSKNSKSKNSSGLGLAIVKAIAEVSGLKMTYSYKKMHFFEIGEYFESPDFK